MQHGVAVPFSPTPHFATSKLYRPSLATAAPHNAYRTLTAAQRRCIVPKRFESAIAPPARPLVVAAAGASDSSRIPAGNVSESDVAFVRQLRVVLAENGLSEQNLPSIKEVASLGGAFLAGAMRTRGYRRVHELLQLVADDGAEGGEGGGVEGVDGQGGRVESWSLGSGSGSLGSGPGSAMSMAQQKAKVLQQRMQQRWVGGCVGWWLDGRVGG
ncbi:unnamed protein product [Closterium sp. NIES-53]